MSAEIIPFPKSRDALASGLASKILSNKRTHSAEQIKAAETYRAVKAAQKITKTGFFSDLEEWMKGAFK